MHSKMKTLQLSTEYPSLSTLEREDRHFFKNLLKGSAHVRYASGLHVMPVSLNAKVMCYGFAVEHHQIIRSQATGQYYLVFWPLLRSWQHHSYMVLESKTQEGYICLKRRQDLVAHHLFPGSNTMMMVFD